MRRGVLIQIEAMKLMMSAYTQIYQTTKHLLMMIAYTHMYLPTKHLLLQTLLAYIQTLNTLHKTNFPNIQTPQTLQTLYPKNLPTYPANPKILLLCGARFAIFTILHAANEFATLQISYLIEPPEEGKGADSSNPPQKLKSWETAQSSKFMLSQPYRIPEHRNLHGYSL